MIGDGWPTLTAGGRRGVDYPRGVLVPVLVDGATADHWRDYTAILLDACTRGIEPDRCVEAKADENAAARVQWATERSASVIVAAHGEPIQRALDPSSRTGPVGRRRCSG
jgi:hypothetical protein